MQDGTCLADGCNEPKGKRRGYCRKHYRKLMAQGSLPRLEPVPMEERFWAKVHPTGFCWEWTGATAAGYGRFASGDRKLNRAAPAHRVAYELLVGPIPDGMHMDHLCRNPICVNPDHLEPVTPQENSLRGYSLAGVRARQTHCQRGHEFTPDNTGHTSRGNRRCRTCDRMAAAARKQRQATA